MHCLDYTNDANKTQTRLGTKNATPYITLMGERQGSCFEFFGEMGRVTWQLIAGVTVLVPLLACSQVSAAHLQIGRP